MQRRSTRVTLHDVAKDAEVSVATVSRIVNNTGIISDETRQRVNQSMEKLAYIPNTIARSLKINSTQTIGFVVSDISNTYHISIARAVEDIISKKGYNLTLCSTGNDKQRELTYLKLLLSQNIAALILNTTGFNDDFIIQMNRQVPMVLLNRRIMKQGFVGDLVDSNNVLGSYLLTKELLANGHRRIFIAKGPEYLSPGIERMRGFTQAMHEYAVEVRGDYPYQYNTGFTTEGGYKAAEYMTKVSPLPTALLTHNNMSTIGALRFLQDHNKLNHQEFSMAAFDTLDNLDLLSFRPTVASFNTLNMGNNAGKAILERIASPELPNREFIEEPVVIQGNSISRILVLEE